MSSMSAETTTGTGSISTGVIAAVAEEEGVDPTDLEPPLYEVIDPDALDAFFARDGSTATSTVAHVTFTYNGYEVHVTGEGDVRVSDSTDR